MSTIAFIGFRGSGKSTLGRWLSEELEVPFVDSDERILAHLHHESVAEAWEQVDEDGWREAELHVIPPLLEQAGVVSLGGGAPTIPQIKHALGSVEVVFNLTANEGVTMERIEAGSDRPELSESDVQSRLNRLPLYAMLGTCGVDTSGDIEDSKAIILNFLKHGHQVPRTGPRPIF